MSMQRTIIISIPVPIPITRIKLECFPLLEEANVAGVVGKCGGVSPGDKAETGAVYSSTQKNVT